MSRSRSALLPLLFVLPACLPHHEALGNRALRAGDVATAAEEYDRAMGDTPMMDFEYERVRKKRKRLMEGEWSPRVDALLATAPTPVTPEYVGELLLLRRDARAAGIPEELADRIDVEVVRVAAPEALRVTTSDAVPGRLAALLALFDTAMGAGAPQESVDAVVAAYGASLAVGLPAAPPTGGLERLEELLTMREAVRGRGFPPAIDAAIDTELAKLGPDAFVPAAPAEGLARFDTTLSLRARARSLGAPAPAIALADAAHADALAHVLALADEGAAAHRYLAVYDQLAPLTARVEPEHPLVGRLAALARDGAAWHTSEAAALPAGYRKLLHLAIAATLSGDRAPAEAARRALEPAFTTSLTLQPELSVDPSCAGMAELVTPSLARGARAIALPLSLARCAAGESDAVSTRSDRYIAEEIYYVQEEVQVGTRLERVQVGTHQEQCSKPADLEGYSWVGLCDVPDYETQQFPVYELQDVEKRRDVERTVDYPVTTHTARAEVSGVATLTWDDGTVLSVPFSQARTESAEAWSYVVPGYTAADRGETYTQTIPSYVAVGPVQRTVGSAAGQEISTGMLARVRAHRARLAREEGARALAAGDDGAAGEAFVRSVLHDGKAEAEAATWLTATTGVDAARVESLLSGGGATRAPLGGPALPVAAVYAPTAIVVGADAPLRVDAVVNDVTTESYQKGILPPNEFVDFHVGIVPTEIQTGSNVASRGAAAIGFDMHYNFLEMATKLRYGFVIHDQFGLRFTMGMTYVEKEEYTNGEEEGPIAVTVDPSYALYLGLRLPWFGVFAGGSAGYLHAASGDTVAFGYHVEPGVRLTVRAFRTKNLTLEASGFFLPVPGVAHKDRLMLSFPVLGKKGVDLKLSVERTLLPARHLAADGETRESLGTLPVNMVGVQVGARL